MQKAFKWLDARKVNYRFHDYKESGIDKSTILNWLKYLPLDKVLNSKSTTYRELTEREKTGITDKEKAIEIMIKNNSIIKRPVWDFGNGIFFLGWNEDEISKLISTTEK